MSTRIYAATQAGGAQWLVRATSQAQAIRHIVRSQYSANVAAQETIVEAYERGERVVDATRDDDEPESHPMIERIAAEVEAINAKAQEV